MQAPQDGFKVKLYSMTQDDAAIEESKDRHDGSGHPHTGQSLFDAVKRESVCLSDYIDDSKSVDSQQNNSLSPGRRGQPVPFSRVNKSFGLSMKDIR